MVKQSISCHFSASSIHSSLLIANFFPILFNLSVTTVPGSTEQKIRQSVLLPLVTAII